MATTNTWDQVVQKITGVVNRGTLNWSGSNTTYVLSSGYYIGGTLDSRPSYTNGYNTGVSAADNRVNTSSASYSSGYNNGYSAGNSAGYNNGYNAGVAAKTSRYASGSKSWSRAEFLTLGFQPNIFMVCGAGGTGSPNGLYCTIGVNMNYARGTSNSSYDNLFYTNANGIGLRDINITYWRDRASVWFAARIV